jgi:hypothetical protein
MGIALWFHGVTPAQIERIRLDHGEAERIIRGDRPHPPEIPTIEFLNPPEPGKPLPDWLVVPDYAEAVDRVYHIIHYILTGTAQQPSWLGSRQG